MSESERKVSATLQALATNWVEREKALHYSRKKAEDACFEFFIGATAALVAVKHPDADHIGVLTTLVLGRSPFPGAVVLNWAAGKSSDGKS